VRDPGTPLYVLRNDLKLKGTRFGCGAGVCGCCTVLLDGRGIQSCNTPVSAAQGREVTTIEGLGGKAAAHPLQQAFVEEQAASALLPDRHRHGRRGAARPQSLARRSPRSVPSSTSTCAGASLDRLI